MPNGIDGDAVVVASRSTSGTGHLVSDAEMFEAQARLAREEGIFTEPAGALVARRAGLLHEGDRVTAKRPTSDQTTGNATLCSFVNYSKRPILVSTFAARLPAESEGKFGR